MDTIVIKSPFDAHLHLRDGDMLRTTARISARSFAGAIVMPNLKPPLTNLQMTAEYQERISCHAGYGFEPFAPLFLTDRTSARDLLNAENKPIAAKLYPIGATTNSENGVKRVEKMGEIFEAMAEGGIALLVHGETSGGVLEREAEFADIYARLAGNHPRLKIIMEHISTKVLADLLMEYENLYATITLHHLLYTIDDLLGGALNPHLFCKPIVKTEADRAALRSLAFSANHKVMFGSDSAPHLREDKERRGAAGVFSAPVLLPSLAELFELNGAIGSLQKFTSDNARAIYGLKLPDRNITLVKEPFNAPREIDGIVPLRAGETISWRAV